MENIKEYYLTGISYAFFLLYILYSGEKTYTRL